MFFISKKKDATTNSNTATISPGRLRLQTDLTEYNEDKIKSI